MATLGWGARATAFRRLIERKSKVNHPKNFPNVSKCDVWILPLNWRDVEPFRRWLRETQQPEAVELPAVGLNTGGHHFGFRSG